MGNGTSSSKPASEASTSVKESDHNDVIPSSKSKSNKSKKSGKSTGILQWLGSISSKSQKNRNTDVTIAQDDLVENRDELPYTETEASLQSDQEKLEPVPSEDAIKASTITTSNKGHPLSRFGFSSFSRSSNPNNRQSEEGARFGLSEGSIRTSSQMSLFPRWGASGGILWNERNNTATGASTRILRDDPTYVPRTQAPKHDILEEVTDKYRQKLESECNDGQQERRLSIRKPVTELLAPERIQFLNQAPSSSSSNKTSSGNTIIYSQPTSETCPEIMMGYLSQREQNNVLWKKYFVVLDSGSISIFKKKKLAPIQQPYGDEIVKSVTLKLFTVSLTDRSVTDYRGNQIPCNLYISPIITSIIKDELEEMVFRSNDMCGNESSLEEWADAFNSHILYNKMTNVVVSS